MAFNTAYPGAMPGANFGGTQQAVPSPGGGNTPAIGGQTNPFTPGVPSGGTQPGISSPYAGVSQAAYPNGTAGAGTQSVATNSGLYDKVPGKGGNNPSELLFALSQMGFPKGVANALVNFMQSGAGFNQDVVNQMIQSLNPQVQQGQANIMEQFGAQGLRNSSPAAYGLGTFEAQTQAAYQQIFSQMYEQSVQNYMQVLMGGQPHVDASPLQQFTGIAGGIGSLLSGIGALKGSGKH